MRKGCRILSDVVAGSVGFVATIVGICCSGLYGIAMKAHDAVYCGAFFRFVLRLFCQDKIVEQQQQHGDNTFDSVKQKEVRP
jgi:hypothetical protein